MTEAQKKKCFKIMEVLVRDHLNICMVHGDCIGADKEFHDIAVKLGLSKTIGKRPCNIKNKRAFTEEGTWLAEPEPPLDRNKKIVDDGTLLIACPKKFVEELRSGTWATIRYARKKNKDIIIIFPDGTIDYRPSEEDTK